MITLSTIKSWFVTDAKPTQSQFWDTWDSFWHKEEKIPLVSIDGVDELFEPINSHFDDDNAHAEQFAIERAEIEEELLQKADLIDGKIPVTQIPVVAFPVTPDASETVGGLVNTATQRFKGNKTVVGESSFSGNAFEVQNSGYNKGLEIPNSNVAGVRSIVRVGTSEMYAKSQRGGFAFAGVENTSGVLGYPKKYSFGNDNLWNIETEYFAGYGIAFVNRLAGKTFETSSFYIGSQGAVADNVGIGTNNPVAKLQVDSTTKGFAPPRMTTAQKNAIVTPMAGLMVFDTTLMKLCIFTTAWETITSI